MKFVICGKGGSGKSTVSALIAREMASRGEKVLVVDTDESNFGLVQAAGPAPAQGLHGLPGRQEGAGGAVDEIYEVGGKRKALHSSGVLDR